MNRMKTNKIRGFTLAELLIVVAITAVLVAVSIPIFKTSLKRSQGTVCEANRKSLLREMVYEQMANEVFDENDAQRILKKSDAYCPAAGPTDGKYSVTVKDLLIQVTCSVHGTTSGGGKSPDNATHTSSAYKSDFVDFVKSYDDGKGKNNDRMRAAFLEKNGGQWPTITVDGNDYIIQPFYKEKSTAAEEADRIWLYAKAPSDSGNWTARMIYVDNQWYGITDYQGNPSLQKGQTITVTKYGTVEDIRNDVANSKKSNDKPAWYKITDFTESFHN